MHWGNSDLHVDPWVLNLGTILIRINLKDLWEKMELDPMSSRMNDIPEIRGRDRAALRSCNWHEESKILRKPRHPRKTWQVCWKNRYQLLIAILNASENKKTNKQIHQLHVVPFCIYWVPAISVHWLCRCHDRGNGFWVTMAAAICSASNRQNP